MSDDLKTLLEEQGKAFAEFKAANDGLQIEVKKLKEDAVTVDKVERINTDLDKLAKDIKAAATRSDEIEAKANRMSLSGGPADDVETKAAKAFAAQTGADVSVEAMREYKAALYGMGGPIRSAQMNGDRKALSVGSDPDGGYLVTPDTAGRIVNRIYETSPVRQEASVMTIGTDSVEGLNDLGQNGFAWVGERNPRLENDTAQLGKWSIVVHEAVSVVSMTQKVLEDAKLDLESWLATKSADRIARGENEAFIKGDGVTKPRGLFAYPTAATADATRAWGTFEHINTGTNGTFGAAMNGTDKLMDLVYALKAAYRSNAKFMTNRSTLREVRKLKDGQGNYIWQPSLVAGQPSALLGYSVVEAEDIDPMGTASLSIAFGDFREAYQIVDRIGLSVLRDPYTAYPYVFFKFRKRVGGGAISFEAVKFLRFSA
jgi:HK97 family phage major capsid protein